MKLAIKVPRRYFLAAIGGAVALAALAFGFGYARFASDVQRATQRVAHGSRIAATQCGPIEYAEMGEGPALLVVHGAGGGFDQGIEFAAELARRGYRVIAVSRFGYLRTPLPADATPQAQADAHACLLDALAIERAAIAGVSAGAPSSLQFAIRHPQRTRALFLLVPLAYRPDARPPDASPPDSRSSGLLGRFMLERAVKSDFLYWLTLRLAPGLVARTILGTPSEALAEASPEEQERAARMMQHIMPLRLRHAGLLNDARVARALQPYPLEKIAAPTLVISVADDLYGTFESAGYTASRIRGARFIGYQRGGHVALGHHGAILDELVSFLSGAANFAVAAL
jgi:pimeloyl-ACP methyl ester carboxylesterase